MPERVSGRDGEDVAGRERDRDVVSLAALDSLLATPDPLDAQQCARLVDAQAEYPGRARRIVERLADQRDAPAVEALVRLPSSTPRVVEGLFAALRRGVCRPRVDGLPGQSMLAIEFRRSDARGFPALLSRAHLAFGTRLEHLQVGETPRYRIALFEGDDEWRRRASEWQLELEHLHRSLLRLRGVRVWINGWRFDDESPLRPAARVPLVRAWLDRSTRQTWP